MKNLNDYSNFLIVFSLSLDVEEIFLLDSIGVVYKQYMWLKIRDDSFF